MEGNSFNGCRKRVKIWQRKLQMANLQDRRALYSWSKLWTVAKHPVHDHMTIGVVVQHFATARSSVWAIKHPFQYHDIWTLIVWTVMNWLPVCWIFQIAKIHPELNMELNLEPILLILKNMTSKYDFILDNTTRIAFWTNHKCIYYSKEGTTGFIAFPQACIRCSPNLKQHLNSKSDIHIKQTKIMLLWLKNNPRYRPHFVLLT